VIDLKKSFNRVLFLLIGVVAGFVIAGLVFVATGFSIFGGAPEKPPSSASLTNAELTAVAFEVLESIRDGDFAALSRFAHPDFGIVFSPYATISLLTNRCFSAEQIASFGSDSNMYVWGVLSGSGEPIEMTPVDYFAEFVFPRDYFACASVIGVNRIVTSGNALENILEEFPGLLFVDFHIPGGARDEPDELDWSSLRLGFEDIGGSLWLTVILRSTWMV